MTTTVLTRPALKPLPAPRPGALLAAHHNPRPCATNPAHWWDTGDRNNGRAIDLCRTACPFLNTCAPKKGELKPLGVIRAGAAYDDRGRKSRLCRTCSGPLNKATLGNTCDPCSRGRLIAQHARIATMREAGCSWAAIGRVVGYHADTVRKYWTRYEQAAAA